MKLLFSGGAAEVGGSCILVRADNKNILMDCGIRQGSNKDPLPDFRSIQEMGGVDAIIISHAHMDHIGSLPLISKEFPNCRIYMTLMTKDLTRVLLYDSLKIMNNREAEIPLYAEIDVQNMLDRVFALNFEREFEILKDIKLTFYMAGHVAGAGLVYLKCLDGSILYSGDFSLFSQNTIEGARIPKLRPDIAILEATYGDRLHSSRDIEEQRLVEVVKECSAGGGKILIPAFALGRAQEVILILKRAMNKGVLPRVKIYVDGMVKNINSIYKLNPIYLRGTLSKKVLRGVEPFYDEYITPITRNEEREQLVASQEACVIISSSGMLTGGPSQYYAEQLLSDEKAYIVLTGYQDEESPGRKLLKLLEPDNEEKKLELNGKSLPVKCRVKSVGLSAHADKSEIKAVIEALAPVNIVLVHGNADTIASLGREISEERPAARVYTPFSGDILEIEIGKPRKQKASSFRFTEVINTNEELGEDNIKVLWEFLLHNYKDRFFTAEELLFIWSGNSKWTHSKNETELRNLSRLILSSPFFEPHIRMPYIVKASSVEEVSEKCGSGELKQNEISDIALKYFGEYGYKKAGLKINDKKVILNFNFPKAVPESINDKLVEFNKVTGWEAEINQATNNMEAENLILKLLGGIPVKKISYFPVEDKFVVTVEENIANEFLKSSEEEFKRIAGMRLEIVIPENSGISRGMKAAAVDSMIMNEQSVERAMEQNELMAFVDTCFELSASRKIPVEHRPYKKSIKLEGDMKYLELSFISPIIGKKYLYVIKDISNASGWNVKISSAVNQNEIMGLAARMCRDRGLKLKKNPSFNPVTLKVGLKLDALLDEETFKVMQREFEEGTGCGLSVIG